MQVPPLVVFDYFSIPRIHNEVISHSQYILRVVHREVEAKSRQANADVQPELNLEAIICMSCQCITNQSDTRAPVLGCVECGHDGCRKFGRARFIREEPHDVDSLRVAPPEFVGSRVARGRFAGPSASVLGPRMGLPNGERTYERGHNNFLRRIRAANRTHSGTRSVR